MEALAGAAAKGAAIVRASRVPLGYLGRNVEVNDDKLNFVESQELTPPKARVPPRLALMQSSDARKIWTMFDTF